MTLFGDVLAEHGICGHVSVSGRSAALVPILGDAPDLIGAGPSGIMVEAGEPEVRVLLGKPDRALSSGDLTRVRGDAQLYAGRALAPRELCDDVETGSAFVQRTQLNAVPAKDAA